MKKRIFSIILFLLLALFLSSGCSQNLYVKAEKPITPVAVKPVKEPLAGSLWRGENAANSMFADRKARYVEDIITIVVQESSGGGNNASTNTSRDTTTSAGIKALLGIERAILDHNASMGNSISVAGTSANSLKGTGNTSRDSNLQARISAKVSKVYDNGNLFVEGRRQLTVNAEDQYLIITGIVRPEDITSDNVILSQHIADARIIYTGKGVIDDKMRPGWLTRVVDWVWPF